MCNYKRKDEFIAMRSNSILLLIIFAVSVMGEHPEAKSMEKVILMGEEYGVKKQGYYIIGDGSENAKLIVPRNKKLTFKEGSVILYTFGAQIELQGELELKGTVAAPIVVSGFDLYTMRHQLTEADKMAITEIGVTCLPDGVLNAQYVHLEGFKVFMTGTQNNLGLLKKISTEKVYQLARFLNGSNIVIEEGELYSNYGIKDDRFLQRIGIGTLALGSCITGMILYSKANDNLDKSLSYTDSQKANDLYNKSLAQKNAAIGSYFLSAISSIGLTLTLTIKK